MLSKQSVQQGNTALKESCRVGYRCNADVSRTNKYARQGNSESESLYCSSLWSITDSALTGESLSLEKDSKGLHLNAETEGKISDFIVGVENSLKLDDKGMNDPETAPGSEFSIGSFVMPISISMDGRDEIE